MRIGWVLKSVAVGITVMLLICYMFSVAFSIIVRQHQMLNKLAEFNDRTFEDLRGTSGGMDWLAALGSLIALFAGGMTATLLSRPTKTSWREWLMPSAVVAVITMLVIDGYMLLT